MNLLSIKDKALKYGWMALAIAAGVLLGVQTWRLHTSQLETAAAVTTLASERAIAATAAANQTANHRKTEQGLNAGASGIRKDIHEQVVALNSRNASLLERVRRAEAAAQSAGVSGTAPAAGPGQAGQGGPGAELLGSLGTTDVQEADRADTIRLHLQGCYRQYDGAQEALKKLAAQGEPK